MLSANKYSAEYVDDCRTKITKLISAYKKVQSTSAPGSGIEEFEPLFFNQMVLALDHYFMHRARGMEKKDGNPLNEVRVLCNSLMEGDGKLAADTQIRLDPARSILGYQVGDEIRLNEADFSRLSAAFLDEIAIKYR